VYPALLKLEPEGSIESEWGVSDNNRKSEILQTHPRRKQLERETHDWQKAQAIVAKFLSAEPAT
jgi:PadR family transcriptional regulator PadR